MKEEAPKLEETMEELRKAIVRLNRTQTIWYAFWHGLVAGIASTVGVAIVLSGIIWVLHRIDFVPGIAHYVDRILPIIEQRITK